MAFPKKCIAIDIGSHQIKIAELLRSGATVKVLNYALISTPKNCLNDGLITDKEAIGDIIKETIRNKKIKTREVIFTIASSKIITREVDFPLTAAKKLKTIIHMNASEYFPVNLEDYILDHYIIDTVESEGAKILKVNIIAALSELVEDYVEVAHYCDLKPAGIDYSGISLVNFAVKNGLDQGVNILLDIGSSSTMVSILDNGVMKFNRNLLYGSSLLIDSIKNHFEVEEDEALRISIERSLLDVDSNENPYLSNDMTGAVNQILTGIGRLIDYYTSRNTAKLERVYLVGGGANVYGLSEYIEQYFNLETFIPKDLSKVVVRPKPDFEAVQIYFVNLIGAMFSDISLVPKSMMAKEKRQTKKRTLGLLIILLLAPMILLTYFKWTSILDLEDRKDQLTLDIQNAQPIIDIKAEYENVQKKVAFRQGILDNSISTTDEFSQTLALFEEIMPEDIFYLNITNTEEGLQISCIAKDKLTVAEFIVALKSAGFVDVIVPALDDTTSNESDEGYVTFAVSLKYGGESDEQ